MTRGVQIPPFFRSPWPRREWTEHVHNFFFFINQSADHVRAELKILIRTDHGSMRIRCTTTIYKCQMHKHKHPLNGVMVFFPPLFCLLKPQLVEADGHPSWVWFCQRFLPIKREMFLSTVASGMLRTGDWTEDKFWCNLLVSLARMLFLNRLYMNELDYFEIN